VARRKNGKWQTVEKAKGLLDRKGLKRSTKRRKRSAAGNQNKKEMLQKRQRSGLARKRKLAKCTRKTAACQGIRVT
jgi:hypothetical protein